MKALVLWALRMKAFWKKEWKYGVTALVGGVLVCVLWSGIYAANIQRGIADGVVRFHVLANSDTAADQNLKLDVRDAVLASFGGKAGRLLFQRGEHGTFGSIQRRNPSDSGSGNRQTGV